MKVVIKGESGWSQKIKENLTGNMAGSGLTKTSYKSCSFCKKDCEIMVSVYNG